jgi:uncharacterized protein
VALAGLFIEGFGGIVRTRQSRQTVEWAGTCWSGTWSIPQVVIARWAGPDTSLAIPAAAVLGTPFYVSTEAFLPIAATPHANGMGLGAVIALTVSAAGVNVPELALLALMMKARLLAGYTLAILAVATVTGYLVAA